MTVEMPFCKPTQEEWVCKANDVIHIKFLHSDKEFESEPIYHPQFTHQLFGENENIFGYKNLIINMYYAAGSMFTYIDTSYLAKIEQKSATDAKAQDVLEILRSKLSPDFTDHKNVFLETVRRDYETFNPARLGIKFHEYRMAHNDNVVYEFYKCQLTNPHFLTFHRRAQIFVLWYIDGASYIDENDDRWEFVVAFEKKMENDRSIYRALGYVSMYPFYAYPDRIRMRISQFLILPHFMNQGHGGHLYRTIYEDILSRKEVIGLTVEDPNDMFSQLRDVNDVRYLLQHEPTLQTMSLPMDRQKVKEIEIKYKLSKNQTIRCCELILLKFLSPDAHQHRLYRLEVKRRLVKFYEDQFNDMERSEIQRHLSTLYQDTEQEYRTILNNL